MKLPGIRIGVGYDSHRFEENRPLVMGGIIIPHTSGLSGHSDADVLLHAIADAILGAAGLGDIGQHFPDTDIKFKDMASIKILANIFEKIVKKGFLIGNIDAVIIAEFPKMAPHIPKMISKIARILMIDKSQVSIKATTNEMMGAIGRGEGIAVIANVILYEDNGTDL
ncbi:MAG: 2-C-methyl-D-erythritol 2,4-cyclodiphosphate synthase [Candidatus Zixiibacteriota bacterium]